MGWLVLAIYDCGWAAVPMGVKEGGDSRAHNVHEPSSTVFVNRGNSLISTDRDSVSRQALSQMKLKMPKTAYCPLLSV